MPKLIIEGIKVHPFRGVGGLYGYLGKDADGHYHTFVSDNQGGYRPLGKHGKGYWRGRFEARTALAQNHRSP